MINAIKNKMKLLEKTVSSIAIGGLLFNSYCTSRTLINSEVKRIPIKEWTNSVDLGTKKRLEERIEFNVEREGDKIKIAGKQNKYHVVEKTTEKQEKRGSNVITYNIYKENPCAYKSLAYFGLFAVPTAFFGVIGMIVEGIAGGSIKRGCAWGSVIGFVIALPGGIYTIYDIEKSVKCEIKTVKEEKSKHYVEEIVNEEIIVNKDEKLIKSEPLANAKLKVYSKDLEIDKSLNTDKNGNAYLPNVRFFTYKEFEKKNSAFLGICDLKRIYPKLDDKKIEITIEYQGKKYEKSIIDKDSNEKKMLKLLKEECF